jgi:hypothetical protein
LLIILRKHILIYFICFVVSTASSQEFCGANWGFNIGAVTALGNKFQRVGFTFQTYYYYNFAQLNAELRIYHNFKNLGPVKQYDELVASAGLVFGYGAKQKEHNPFLSIVSNQTKYVNSFGYAYNLYFNKVKTTQQTGIIAFQFNKIGIISENDILARPTLDRFRTGAFLVQYQYKNLYQFAVNCTMWTGQMGNKITTEKGCYMDTTTGIYTNYSHGLLSAQFKMTLDGGQNLQANVGIDAEQVRNFVQNRLIHDMIFIPKRWNKSKNCHLPMLDTENNQFINKTNQKVKSIQPYWNIFSSAAVFY